MNNIRRTLVACFFAVFLGFPSAGGAVSIYYTDHNLSVTGPGEIKSLTETRICVFCHTPHNATPQTPLWNKKIEPQNYVLYSGIAMSAPISQPTGPTRLCLSCHDGTIGVGDVLNPQGRIQMIGSITNPLPSGEPRPSFLDVNLSNDHPVDFSYDDSLATNSELNPPPANLPFYTGNINYVPKNNIIHCSTCHDAHEDTYPSPDKNGRLTGKFLVVSNRGSAFCILCHNIPNWSTSSHSTSTDPVDPAKFPVAPRTWPTWTTVREWGCEGCHTAHGAKGAQGLFYFEQMEDNCYLCHSTAPAPTPHGAIATASGPSGLSGGVNTPVNVKAQFNKLSVHPVRSLINSHRPNENPLTMPRHVTCADCHNAHAARPMTAGPSYSTKSPITAERVSGVSIDGNDLATSTYEYEVCLKCHADTAPQNPFIPRVVNSTNKRLQFAVSNMSYHPVAGVGKNRDIPSLMPPSTSPDAPQQLNPSSVIYCTDCHGDDTGNSRGVHGSAYPPILKRRYETTMGTPESYENYRLCYTCHNRDSILSPMGSFKPDVSGNGGHSGHLKGRDEMGRAVSAPCSVCHDAHGVESARFLINFDTRYVKGPNDTDMPQPTFVFNGMTPQCSLVCHYDPSNYNVTKVHTIGGPAFPGRIIVPGLQQRPQPVRRR